MKKIALKLLKIFGVIIVFLYILICGWFYFEQESIIFYPEKLDSQFKFSFEENFEEVNIRTKDDVLLNALLFKAKHPKGLVFYLHGNGGSLEWWGQYAGNFIDLNYDVFFWDYRGYGKSEGTITSEEQFYRDAQTVYDHVKELYPEDKIIILGTSLGTAAGSKIAADNRPAHLILLSPYYSLGDMMRNIPFLKVIRIVPTFLLKYDFKNFENIQRVQSPVTVFHGDKDEIIYYGSSLKLQKEFKPGDTLITIKDGSHALHHHHPQVNNKLKEILNRL